ncbi:MAG: DEAD/DEAH box helicase [Verrucomicrobia bacterium]|nr:DEAD/DEAH box helicase [Verrucomicrobiota bacterium]
MKPKLFSELGLSAEMLKAIAKLGFEQASPIQAEAIPVLMAGHDAVGQSQTGSGKTAAFGIPAVEKVDATDRAVQVLILCPTRELAVQVSEEMHKLAFFKRGLHVLPIYGGQSYERQFLGLKQGAQIVIGTPGRVMDHMRRGTLRLDKIRMAILDEADVMLNMGFRDDIEVILQAAPVARQTVFFSATMPRPIRELIEKYAREPRTVRIEQKALTVPTVEQVYYEVDRRYKIELLTRLIDLHDLKLGIVFCNTKRMVDDLVDHLNAQGYSADRLHGDMSQAMRDRVMQKFRKSGLEFLVATDVAARGIDVDDVEVVFNYDLPYDGEDYVHRIGRTGRKGREGRAISFASGREVFQIRNIERFTNVRIQRGKAPTAGEVLEAKANALMEKLRQTLKAGEYKRQDHLIERLLEEGHGSTDIASALLHHLQTGEPLTPGAKPSREDRPSPAASSPDYLSGTPAKGERWDRPEGSERPWDRVRERARPPQPRTREYEDRGPSPEKFTRPAPRPAPIAEASRVPPAPSAVAPRVEPEAPREPKNAIPTPPAEAPSPSPKASRRTPAQQIRLWMNLGETEGVVATDVMNAVAGTTGLPMKVVGAVDIRDHHLFVDVASEHANAIIAKLNRTQIKGRKVKVKVA